MTDREVFLDYLAKKSGRPRHQLKDHPLVAVNDLPETTLSAHTQDEQRGRPCGLPHLHQG